MIERKFIERSLRDLRVQEYLATEMGRADFSKIEIHRTPLATRVAIYAARPGVIIGRAGTKIKELTDILQQRFGLENPQLEVRSIERPELDAQIVAKQIAGALERGVSYRRLAMIYLKQVMEAGAIGIEIVIGGKISGERSRSERFFSGYIRKCGEPALRYVDHGFAQAILKAGTLGVKVSLMTRLPAEMLLKESVTANIAEYAAAQAKISEVRKETYEITEKDVEEALAKAKEKKEEEEKKAKEEKAEKKPRARKKKATEEKERGAKKTTRKKKAAESGNKEKEETAKKETAKEVAAKEDVLQEES